MEHMGVAEKLDISHFKDHMQGKAYASLFENLGGMHLSIGEIWNGPSSPQPLQADVRLIPFSVHTTVGANLFVEDWLAHEWLLSDGNIALAVPVPTRFAKRLYDIGVLSLQGVENVVRTHDVAFAALERTSYAEKPNNVTVIRVEVLSSCCSVDSNTLSLASVFTNVFDVTKNVSISILRDEISEMSSEAHVCYCRLVVVPSLDRQTFEEDESFAVE